MAAATLSAVALCFTTSLALANDVLYCTDTAAVGFSFDNTTGKVQTTTFTQYRYTVKVISDTERSIVRMSGDIAGVSNSYTCHSTKVPADEIICDEALKGGDPWVFYKNNFTHAFLPGTPVGPANSMDPNI